MAATSYYNILKKKAIHWNFRGKTIAFAKLNLKNTETKQQMAQQKITYKNVYIFHWGKLCSYIISYNFICRPSKSSKHVPFLIGSFIRTVLRFKKIYMFTCKTHFLLFSDERGLYRLGCMGKVVHFIKVIWLWWW